MIILLGQRITQSSHVFSLTLHVFFLEICFEAPNKKLLLRPEAANDSRFFHEGLKNISKSQ
jgi:hypothetical protein